jgi:predicted transcriptional regulator
MAAPGKRWEALFHMTVGEIARVLDAKVVTGEDMLGREVHSACGSDLMSDVLAYVKDQSVLVTGLVNAQAARTAEVMDIVCIVIVRGKNADPSLIDLAKANDVAILETRYTMFAACGILYEHGLRGGGRDNAKKAKSAL